MGTEIGVDRLEVSLIHRRELDKTDAIFYADVLAAGTYKGRRYLELEHAKGLTETLFLDDHLLLTINYYPVDGILLDPTDVDPSDEDQNEGFEIIGHILEDAELSRPNRVEGKDMTDVLREPRRVEVELKPITGFREPIKLVVLAHLPPLKTFHYHTLRGRQWTGKPAELEDDHQVFHSTSWWVHSVTRFMAPGQSTACYFPRGETRGFESAGRAIEDLAVNELAQAAKWKPSPVELTARNWNDNYRNGCGHHSAYSPKPSKVAFRVAGDDAGKTSYLAQAKRAEKGTGTGPPPLKEFLADSEKKSAAEDIPTSDKRTSSASTKPDKEGSGGDRKRVSRPLSGNVSLHLPSHATELGLLGSNKKPDSATPGSSYSIIPITERAMKRNQLAASLDYLRRAPYWKKRGETLH